MRRYDQQIGRLGLRFEPTYGDMRSVNIRCRVGWNDGCDFAENIMSVEELRDLQYLISRALAAADTE